MNKYQVLEKYFGYDTFRQGQEKIIDAIIGGRDALGVMPTGAGKSVCFQVPAMLLRGVTVVISPLISLMKDQVMSLNCCGIPSVYINTAMTDRERDKAVYKILNGKIKLIYVAPERLTTSFFVSLCKKIEISLIAVDEAHCVSQWGQDFRPAYLKISDFVASFEKRPVLCAFTATATPKVKEDIEKLLCLENPETVVTSFDRSNLYFEVVKPRDKRIALKRYLDLYTGKSGIIYCSSRKCVDELYEYLRHEKYPIVKYHAGMPKSQRAENQELFSSDKKEIIVATNAFGMGIDKPNVSFVIHYNMPGDLESYYQEAGRAGRDGNKADCILLFGGNDVRIQQYFINNPEENDELTEEEKKRLKLLRKRKLAQMVAYCESEGCLRRYILSYFGEKSESCGNCSCCTGELRSGDVTVAAQKIFSCIKRLGEKERAETVKDVLKGNLTSYIEENEFHKLSTFGIMSDAAESVISEHISYFLSVGYIASSKDGVLSLSGKCKPVLKSEKAVRRLAERTKKQEKAERPDMLLFAKLRNLRKECAQKASVPDFIIFDELALFAMARHRPTSLEQMKLLPGISTVKAEKYGALFLKEINRHCSENLENQKTN